MQGILAIGEQYLQFPDVERSFCHAISNVSMKADYAKLLIELVTPHKKLNDTIHRKGILSKGVFSSSRQEKRTNFLS